MILTIDQGTTSTYAALVDENGNIVKHASKAHKQTYPQNAWVSHDAEEIYQNVIDLIRQLGISDVKAIGITNQRETLVLWDKRTGTPVADAIVWQCKRTVDICDKLSEHSDTIRSKTGLVVDPYFTASKLIWAKKYITNDNIIAGTIDSYLVYRLSGCKSHVTDHTNASRTMMYNIAELKWDDDLLSLYGITKNILPEIVPSSGKLAETSADEIGRIIPICGIAGDQHASLFGQLCHKTGDIKNTYGTGCFILQNIGGKPIIKKGSKMLTTLAWCIDKPVYALEGSVFSAGASVDWMINNIGLVDGVDSIARICESIPDNGGVYFIPALSGLGTPHWNMNAKASFNGLTLATDRRHMIRAVMESICLSTRDVIEYMSEVSASSAEKLKVDGGITKNGFVMQFQSDILQTEIECAAQQETTALGAAYLAGLGVGIWHMDDIQKLKKCGKTYTPKIPKSKADEIYGQWRKLYDKFDDK
jgi:glycerol kinase